MWAIPISILFGFFGVLSMIIGIQHRKLKATAEIFYNDISMALIYFMCAFSYPFLFANRGVAPDAQQTLFIIADIVLLAFAGFLFYFVMKDYIMGKRDPDWKEARSYEKFLVKRKEEIEENPEKIIKMDVNRKLLHLIPVGVITLCFLIAYLFEDFLVSIGISAIGFGYWFVVLIGYAFCVMFMLAESFRLINYHKLFYLDPEWAHKWFLSSITDKEINSFIASIPLVLCLMPFVFGPVSIFFSVGYVACLSDASASIFGKRFGKHKLPMNKKKSWEGLIAGTGVTFLTVVIITLLIPLPGVTSNLLLVILMAAGTSIVFMVIDMYAKRIGDNILNPLMCGSFMVVFLNISMLI